MLFRPFLAALALLAAGCTQPVTDPDDAFEATPPRGLDVLATARELSVFPDGTTWFRIPGTEPNTRQAHLLRERLIDLGFEARLQHFNASLPLTGPTHCHNVLGMRPGPMGDAALVLAAHYDTRARADKDPDPARRNDPVPGANDGASGVAVVLALAEVLQTKHTLWVYFFDCEDQGDRGGGWAIGAQHAADALSEAQVEAIRAFVLFDLVGDAQLRIPREGGSHGANPWLVDLAFGVAQREGIPIADNVTGPGIQDDHTAFLARGVPAIDLIHLDLSPDGDPFPASHHTTFDDVDHLSADSLGHVAHWGVRLIERLDQKPI